MDNYKRVILLGVESVFGGYDRRWEADLDYERKLIIFPRATFHLNYNTVPNQDRVIVAHVRYLLQVILCQNLSFLDQ